MASQDGDALAALARMAMGTAKELLNAVKEVGTEEPHAQEVRSCALKLRRIAQDIEWSAFEAELFEEDA